MSRKDSLGDRGDLRITYMAVNPRVAGFCHVQSVIGYCIILAAVCWRNRSGCVQFAQEGVRFSLVEGLTRLSGVSVSSSEEDFHPV